MSPTLPLDSRTNGGILCECVWPGMSALVMLSRAALYRVLLICECTRGRAPSRAHIGARHAKAGTSKGAPDIPKDLWNLPT